MAISPWFAGEKITAAKLNAITPTWSSWTPAWSTTTGSATPNIGNGVYNCLYMQAGDLVNALFEVSFGSTTSFGGGGGADNWQWTLPVPAASAYPIVGAGEIHHTSGTSRLVVRSRVISTTHFCFEVASGRVDYVALVGSGIIDAVTPWTWTSSGAVRATLTYRAA